MAECVYTTPKLREVIEERKKLYPGVVWKTWGQPMGSRNVRPRREVDDDPDSNEEPDDSAPDAPVHEEGRIYS